MTSSKCNAAEAPYIVRNEKIYDLKTVDSKNEVTV